MDDLLAWLVTDGDEVVVLPRDPEWGYVYWQRPPGSDGAELRVIVDDADHGEQEVERFLAGEERGGRFFRFAGPDRRHRCELVWPEGTIESAWILSPRRAPGPKDVSFVQVEVGARGLLMKAVDHEVQGRGIFEARRRDLPSSQAFIDAEK